MSLVDRKHSTQRQMPQIVLGALADGEKRVLSLVVAVRRALQGRANFKGDLTGSVKLILRSLIADGHVREADGMYSLSRKGHAAAR
jgi:hypothetical protein